MEKKQRNLTTIAVSFDTVNMIDDYCQKYNIKGRKEFIELSIKYFQNGGYDLNDVTIQGISQVETLVDKLTMLYDKGNEPNIAYNNFLLLIDKLNNNQQLFLPPTEKERMEIEEKLRLENSLKEKERELSNLKKQMAQILKNVTFLKKTIGELIKDN